MKPNNSKIFLRMSNQVMTNIGGGVNWTEAFRPVKSNNTVVDSEGNEWKQITSTGYERIVDGFFWPADPRNSDNDMESLPHSVEMVAKMRERMKKK